MRTLNYFKSIYSGEDAFRKHLLLFSITGILTLLINNILSGISGSILTVQLTVQPASFSECLVDFVFTGILWFHIFGYEYKFLNNIMNDGEITLPEFDSGVFLTFCKMIPIFVLWQIYFFVITFFTGIYTFATNDLVYYFLAGTFMLFITPFVFMIYVKFAKDFKYTKDVLTPLALIKIIDKGLVDVVIWSIKLGAFALIPAAFMIGYMDWAVNIDTQIPRLIAYLGGLCVSAYIFMIFKLIYGLGIANIIKEKNL
jgi:hypothetical protein